MQRNKGARVERLLVQYLTLKKYRAKRVPLSGSASGFKSDVVMLDEDGNIEIKIECKARAKDFDKIYAIADVVLSGGEPTWDFTLNGVLVRMTYEFDALYKQDDIIYRDVTGIGLHANNKRTFTKIINMRKLLGEASILAIKGDRKPFLFFHYR